MSLAASASAQDDREATARFLAGAWVVDALPLGTFRYLAIADLIRNSKDAAEWDPAIFASMPRVPTAALWGANARHPRTSAFYKVSVTTPLWRHRAADLAGRALGILFV